MITNELAKNESHKEGRLFGLNGNSGAGKDTVAQIMVEEYGAVRVALGDPVREMLEKIDPYLWYGENDSPALKLSTILEMYSGDWDRFKASAREGHSERLTFIYRETVRLLVAIGQAVRDIDPGFWIRAADMKVRPLLQAGKTVVVSDVRQVNEAEWIRRNGYCFGTGKIFFVDRPGTKPIGIDEVLRFEKFCFDWTIYNNREIEDLKRIVRATMSNWQVKPLRTEDESNE